MPFAVLGFFLATLHSGQGLSWRLFALVLFCMVFARSAAMAFNRYLDRSVDERNPRTRSREIPAGVISPRAALVFVIISSLLFVLCTWFINPLCFALSPVALAVILGYSYTKRFTFLCHFVLGLGLSLAPIGAYLAVTGRFDMLPLLYSAAVLLWVSGFDIIYALQDEDFDRSLQLHSVPAALGKKKGACALLGIAFRERLVYTRRRLLAEPVFPGFRIAAMGGRSGVCTPAVLSTHPRAPQRPEPGQPRFFYHQRHCRSHFFRIGHFGYLLVKIPSHGARR